MILGHEFKCDQAAFLCRVWILVLIDYQKLMCIPLGTFVDFNDVLDGITLTGS
jgi:hypothetical protein